ncbi:MOSC domain-containing protein [Shewanella sp. D64]|uniref:MOSC domain-containing protein n=1 Tax=unclassified Shewanella TaxID=196818 RepID=UPI0022BA45E6|nr:MULTISPECIES: MOSC domain-containing protein [unclassified Shewanella]MEC4727141.1 MOSC domain-containing protein [Shewanella sp. D64]MEC4739242.1 MOSC domain-containing protein [Shewanella sp. E94]WBJ98323.1 MOSC domain-containing protein [Shewanella sp. MTB7]
MPTLSAIGFKPMRQGPMTLVDTAQVTKSSGVEQDFFGRPGKRQVTVMSQDQWDIVCAEINIQLPWTIRRANLLIEDYTFSTADLGKRLKIGDLELLITGETDPCKKMEIAQAGLEKALTPDWRGGVTCRVLNDAQITQGDVVTISETP